MREYINTFDLLENHSRQVRHEVKKAVISRLVGGLASVLGLSGYLVLFQSGLGRDAGFSDYFTAFLFSSLFAAPLGGLRLFGSLLR